MNLSNKLIEKRDKLAKEHNESLKYFENASFDQVYKNGFNTGAQAVLKEVQGLIEALESTQSNLFVLANLLKRDAKNKEQGIYEHDACLIASGFLKSINDKALKKYRESMRE